MSGCKTDEIKSSDHSSFASLSSQHICLYRSESEILTDTIIPTEPYSPTKIYDHADHFHVFQSSQPMYIGWLYTTVSI